MKTSLGLAEREDLGSDVKNLEIPESCYKCGLSNVNIWGTRMNGILRVEVRCMRCGKPLSKLENDELTYQLKKNIKHSQTLAVTEQIQVSSLQMICPKCKVEISITDDPIYGKVYVCETCGILVIERNARADKDLMI